ncbi:MAG: SDR family oxidoreductase [Planctomycetota bacterium]|jgi:NAD(P)-dependent dehydrogenase (short-subunit alcohol dehydrogenase family)
MACNKKLFCTENKTVVITGGAGVLCGAMAKGLAKGLAKVCILDFDAERSEALCKEIESEGGTAVSFKTDVLDQDQIDKALDFAVDKLGHVDILINGAGGNKKQATCVPPESLFFDLDPEAVRWVFDLNCMGTILPSQAFGRHMAEREEGVIVNVSSMNAFRPLTRIAAYSAAKAAISNFTQWLSTYMCQNHSPNIRVNAIAPGFFLTEQNRFLLTDEATGELTPRGQQILDHTPQGRFGDPEDLLGTLVWLVSDAAKFVTGIVVPVDGGFSAYSGV